MEKLIKSVWKKKRSKFRLTLSVLALGVLVLAMGVGVGWAATAPAEVWVDDNYTDDNCDGHTWGTDAFAKIQDGIDAVAEGGTVHVAAGTYNEKIKIEKSLTLQVKNGDTPTIDGNNAIDPIVEINATSAVTFTGFTVTNAAGYGIKLNSSSNNIVTYNTCSSNTQYGIYLNESSNNTITNNTCSLNTQYGIYLNSSPGNTVTYNTCRNNTYGIYLNSSSGNTFENNICRNNTYGIYLNSSSDSTINENNIHDNTGYGVVENGSSGEVNATKNWWGNASGPSHAKTNPDGKGNAVSNNVEYNPWYIDSGRTTLSNKIAQITVTASPSSISADGTSTSTITATVKDASENPANGASVTFTTNLGTITSPHTTDSDGVATATLTAGTTSGTAVVKATANGASATTTVTLTPGSPSNITLFASPSSIIADGTSTSTITANVKDTSGNPANGASVTFTTSLGTITSPHTTSGGVATATLTSATSGTAVVKATANGISNTIQVDITADVVGEEVTETISGGETDLVEGPAESDTTVKVTTTAEVEVTITNYTDNPHPEATSPMDSLDKYCDVSVSNPDAISWPIRVEVSYTEDEIAAKGFIEESLKLYYFKDGAWHRCSNTGVDTAKKIVWAEMTREEASGSPIDAKGSHDTTPETTKAKLEITKVANYVSGSNPPVADAGGTITYTITYGNIGTGDATSVVISDVVPEDTTFVSATDGGIYDSATNTVTWHIELIPAGTTGLTVSFDVKIDNDLPPGTTVITNQAGIASYYGTELTDEALSNEVNTTVVVPSLEIDKSVDTSTAVTGDIITYTVKLTNINTHDEALDIEISDKLPFGIVYISGSTAINGVLTSDPSGSNPFSWRIDAIAAESTATITYKCAIGLNAVAGFHDNEATIESYSVDGITLALDSPRAMARVKVVVFETKGIIIGKVFEDLNGDGWQDEDEPGIPGIDIVMEDGTTVTTDVDGKYSIPGVEPGYHVLTIDEATLPEGYEILGEVSKFVEVPEVGMAKLNSTVVKQQEGEAKRDSG